MLQVDTKALRAKLEALILEQVPNLIPGEEKMDAVVDAGAKWLDEHVRWGFLGPVALFAEAVDGKVFRAVVGLVAQVVYEQLKDLGKV